jgi:hypothetical protein
MNKQSVKKVLRFLALFTLILMSVTFITSCLSENTGDQDEAGSNLEESETQKLEEVIEEKGSWEKDEQFEQNTKAYAEQKNQRLINLSKSEEIDQMPESEVVARDFISNSLSCNSKLKKWPDFSSDSGELEYLLDCRASQIKKRRNLSGFKRVTLYITLEKVASWSEENEAMYIFDSQENIYFDGEVSIQSGAKGNYVVLLSKEDDKWKIKSALTGEGSFQKFVKPYYQRDIINDDATNRLSLVKQKMDDFVGIILNHAEISRMDEWSHKQIEEEFANDYN